MLEVREPRHVFTCSVSMPEFDLLSEVPVSSQSSYWSLLFVPLIPLKIQPIHSEPVYPLRRTMALMSWPLELYGVNPEGARVESGGHRQQCWFFFFFFFIWPCLRIRRNGLKGVKCHAYFQAWTTYPDVNQKKKAGSRTYLLMYLNKMTYFGAKELFKRTFWLLVLYDVCFKDR